MAAGSLSCTIPTLTSSVKCTTSTDIPSTKQFLRAVFRQRRRAIGAERRNIAAQHAAQAVAELSLKQPFVLSYASFGDELDTWAFNTELAAQGKLLLPRVSTTHVGQLDIFHVSDIDGDLVRSPLGILEPDPKRCRVADLSQITLVLVPGLAFDGDGQRLGYGKGYYDRFLKDLAPHCLQYGIGFQEQFSADPLPASPTDVAVHQLLLY